jgi:DNA-binding NarL/FixJ family response regulator
MVRTAMSRQRARMGNEESSIRLLIADDHALVRSGLRSMLEREPGFEIIGEAEDGREAVELCRSLRPDLILMDVRMPRMDGLEATRTIKQESPEIGVLMVTMHENPDYMLEAIKAGAAGYVLKDAPLDELITAARRVVDGEPSNHQASSLN